MRTNTSSPILSRRGAARISAVWMIVVVVLLLVVLGYAYIAQDEAATTERARAAAVAEQSAADARLETANQELRTRSEVLGFTPDAATQGSNVDSAKAAIEELKTAFPDMEPVKTFQDAVPAVKKAYQAKLAQIGDLQSSISDLQSQIDALRSAKKSSEDEKDATIAALRQEKDDIEQTLKSDVSRLESTAADLRKQVNERGDQITALQDEIRVEQRNVVEGKKEFASVKAGYGQILNDIQKRSEKPDGEISAVLTQYDIALINLTAADRLSEGIEFDIISGRPGADRSTPKARGRVIDVGTEFSRIQVYGVVDKLGQPVVTGDLIFNPLYEKKGERNAVLAGNISGTYNEPELRELFKEIGINVQDEVSNTTDFLITGGPLFVDENGDPLDEPMRPEDLPVYGEARDRGVVVIPVRDVMQYFRR